MLTAQLVDDFDGYGFGGSAAVQGLQQQLTALAQAANWPAVNPGQVTGTVNTQTIVALAAVIPQLAGLDAKVRDILVFAINGAIAMGAVSAEIMAQAQKVVEQYATYLSGAVGLLIAKYGKGSAPPVTQPNPAGIKIVKTALPAAMASMSAVITTMTTAGTWRIAVPRSAGLGGRGFGAAYQEVAPSTSKPPGATVVTPYTFNLKTGSLPFYKDWRIMVPAGVGLAAVLGLVVWWWRR